MKKFLLSLFALLGVVSANAQELTIADVEVVPGQEVTFPVQFAFTDADVEYRDFELHVTFPEGIKATNAVTGDALDAGASAGFNLVDNDSRFTTVDLNGNPAKNGAVWNITIAADASMAEGTYEAKVTYAEVGLTSGKYVFPTFSFNIVVTNTLTLDENSTAVPTSAEGVNVLVKRTIKAGEWSTLCFPFDMTAEQVSEVFGEGSLFSTFASYTKDGGNASTSQKFTATSINLEFESYDWTEDGIFANVPYLIKSKNDVSSFELENVTIDPLEDEANIPYKRSGKVVGTAYGTLHAGEFIPQYGLFLSGGKFYYSQGKTKIKAFRGYFVLNDILADLSSAAGVKMDFDVTTNIDGVRLTDSEGAVYTVDGKFIGRDVDLKKLQKGIYVVDGKKVAVK